MTGLSAAVVVLTVGVSMLASAALGGGQSQEPRPPEPRRALEPHPDEPDFGEEGELPRLWVRPDELRPFQPGEGLGARLMRRTPLAPDVNAALVIIDVENGLPEGWLESADEFLEGFILAPPGGLPNADRRRLNELLTRAEDVVPDVRKLADLPRGTFPKVKPEECEAPDPWFVESLEATCTLLELIILRNIHDGEGDLALKHIRAMIHAARCVEDLPSVAGHEARTSWVVSAAFSLQLVLEELPTSTEELRLTAELFGEEAGENVYQHLTLAAFLSIDWWNKVSGGGTPPEKGKPPEEAGLAVAMTKRIARLHAHSKQPTREWLPRARQWDEQADEAGLSYGFLLPQATELAKASLEHLAFCRVAHVALALELYRREHGSWPNSPGELISEGLPELPEDPYTGRPLRLEKLPFGGYLIQSQGENRRDDFTEPGEVLPRDMDDVLLILDSRRK